MSCRKRECRRARGRGVKREGREVERDGHTEKGTEREGKIEGEIGRDGSATDWRSDYHCDALQKGEECACHTD
jgi:hypothetical protein